MQYTVEYKPYFRKCLTEVEGYITDEIGNPRSAEMIVGSIIKYCRMLKIFPKGNPVFLKKRGKELRLMHIRSYTVVFSVDDERRVVSVEALYYSRRDVEGLIR